MILYIVDNDKLDKYYLHETNENFLFKYVPKNSQVEYFFNVFAKDGNWYFRNDEHCHIGDFDDVSNDSVLLKVYNKYKLNIRGYLQDLVLFCCESTPEEVRCFQIKSDVTTDIFIGNGKECQIFDCNLFDFSEHVKIKLENDIWYLNNNSDPNCYLYLNNKKVTKKALKRGDVIFINGVKIIWMKEFIKILDMAPVSVRRLIPIKNPELSSYEKDAPEEESLNLYEENEYFYHKPYLKDSVENKKVIIDPPPRSEIRDELPAWLAMGSRITMLSFSLVMFLNAYNTYMRTQDFASTLPSLIIAVAMIVGSLIFPSLVSKYQKKMAKKKEKLRQDKYCAYLSSKVEEIKRNLEEEKKIMLENNHNASECYEIMQQDKSKIWNRVITEDDFLSVRVGVGTLQTTLEIEAPKKHFELYDDNLIEEVYKVENDSKVLYNVPIVTSLSKNPLSAIISSVDFEDHYINGIILQLLTNQSSSDLKIVVMTSSKNKNKWEYLKNAPHCWNNEKTFRYFATNLDEMKEVVIELEKELKERRQQQHYQSSNEDDFKDTTSNNKRYVYKNFKSYYLIIVDDYKNAKNLNLINELTEIKTNYGFSLLFITNSIQELPNSCNNLIYVNNKEDVSCVLNKNDDKKVQINFVPEYFTNINLNKAISIVANIPIAYDNVSDALPSNISFLEMYNAGRVEQLNILNRWKTNNPINSLQAPIGVYANRDLLKLDLHEKSHGPHGLIAGSTGSGKSELLITYILSMAINYHPDYVQFVLIDYKGGGLAGAFENRDNKARIPHLAGTITNLDSSSINRTLVSIESELKRRQEQFNAVKNRLGESTIDIYKYQKLYHDGVIEEPIPHLIIISDEFAELKQQQPEFMSQLISTARIGRSLGVHLILATQKPSGVVNDQIWSNSKFKICLRVQTRSDSMEMLKRDDAANIKETGRFYLQVGYNDLFEEGQSAWCGAPYFPSDTIVKKIDNSIEFVDNLGHSIKKIERVNPQTIIKDDGEQLTSIVNYLINVANSENIVTKTLWLEPLEKEIYINELKKKYNFNSTPYKLEAILGEYDNPANQEQGLVTLNLSDEGHLAIYGMIDSGKENLIYTIISSLVVYHGPTEVNFYLIDFASETMKMFLNLPHVGDVIYSNESEKISNLFNFLNQEIIKRKELFEDYMGDYKTYNEKSQNKLPQLVIVIAGYDKFLETYDKYRDVLITLFRDSSKYGIHFIISTTLVNAILYKVAQLFPNKICLQLQDRSEYHNILGASKQLVPADVFGRGLTKISDNVFEFQTAMLCPREDFISYINKIALEYEKINPYYAPKIKVLPESILLNHVINKDSVINLNNVPIGLYKNNLNIASYDFLKFKCTPIISNFLDEEFGFVNALIEELRMIQNCHIKVIDVLGLCGKVFDGVEIYQDDFTNVVNQICEEVKNESTSDKFNIYIFVGISRLKSKVSTESYQLISNVFNQSSELMKSVFIFIDNYSSYRNIESELWYSSAINNSNGIWLGDGINAQLALKISNLSFQNKEASFKDMGYIIHNGKQTLLKHITDVSKEDENE